MEVIPRLMSDSGQRGPPGVQHSERILSSAPKSRDPVPQCKVQTPLPWALPAMVSRQMDGDPGHVPPLTLT